MRYPTNQPTDRPTDRAYHRDARTHLKTGTFKKGENESAGEFENKARKDEAEQSRGEQRKTRGKQRRAEESRGKDIEREEQRLERENWERRKKKEEKDGKKEIQTWTCGSGMKVEMKAVFYKQRYSKTTEMTRKLG